LRSRGSSSNLPRAYTLDDNGYVRNRKVDWSEALQSSARVKYYNEESKKLEKDKALRVDKRTSSAETSIP
jgi:hypothetical protein